METEIAGKFRLVLVEDHSDYADTLVAILSGAPELEVVGVAPTEGLFRTLIAENLPEMALIDLGLQHSNSGLGLLSWLSRDFPAVKPVVLTSSEDRVLACYEAGARGYLLKSHPEELVPTLLRVSRGELVIPPNVGELFLQQVMLQGAILRQNQELSCLSEREKEILVFLHQGLTREEAANRLSISFYTVRRHLQNALEKTGSNSVKELIQTYQAAFGHLGSSLG